MVREGRGSVLKLSYILKGSCILTAARYALVGWLGGWGEEDKTYFQLPQEHHSHKPDASHHRITLAGCLLTSQMLAGTQPVSRLILNYSADVLRFLQTNQFNDTQARIVSSYRKWVQKNHTTATCLSNSLDFHFIKWHSPIPPKLYDSSF